MMKKNLEFYGYEKSSDFNNEIKKDQDAEQLEDDLKVIINDLD